MRREVIGVVIGKPGRMWGIRVLMPVLTEREPVAWIYVRGLRAQIGLRWRPWIRSGRVVSEPHAVQLCEPCAEFQRGERPWAVVKYELPIHVCERIPPSWMASRCPCGCDEVRSQRRSELLVLR